MENKKNNTIISVSIGSLLVALIIIIVVCCTILIVDKKSDESEVKNYSSEIKDTQNIVEDGNDNIENEEIQVPDYIEGLFAYENSDGAYRFYKDGSVILSGNVTEEIGTYNIYNNNSIILTFTELITYDLESGVTSSSSINRTQVLKYIDDNTLFPSDDETYPIIRFPES